MTKSNRPKPDLGTLEVLPSENDNMLGRSVTVARFMGTRRYELINAELIKIAGNEMVFSGLERRYSAGGGRADYAQTWVVQLIP